MFGRGKIMGPILVLAGLGICGVVGLFMGIGVYSEQTSISGAFLGAVLFGFLPMLILVGIGAYLTAAGRKEEAETEQIQKKQRILGMIQAKGQAPVGDIMIEMKMTQAQVTEAIYELVNLNLFTGFVDWEDMIFYSSDARMVGSNECPNCGGIREMVGKGVVKCPYCGVSLFIPPNTEDKQATPVPPKNQSEGTETLEKE